MRKLLYEIGKNFRLMFRNWTTLALLILAPLILILLVGYAFNSDEMHGIKIGMIQSPGISLDTFISNVSSYATVVKYDTVEPCIKDMVLEKTHICLTFRGSFSSGNFTTIPGGEITFYNDNTRIKITTALISELKDFFGVTAEQISVVSAQGIFDNIQNLLFFLRERMDDVNKVKFEALQIKKDLTERKQKLMEVRDSFLPKYNLMKDAQKKINNYTLVFNATYTDFYNEVNKTHKIISQMRPVLSRMDGLVNNVTNFNITNITTLPDINITNITTLPDVNITNNITNNISAEANLTTNVTLPDVGTLNETISQRWLTKSSLLNSSINLLDLELAKMLNITNLTRKQYFDLKEQFDSVVIELDLIKELLDDEIDRTDYYIYQIDQSLEKIVQVTDGLNSKMQSLLSLDPGLAQKLVKPIAQNFTALLANIKNIQLSFPLLLAAIGLFISLLFSNIVTLLEVHSKAYLRNIIAPVNDIIYTSGLVVTNFIIILFQVGILLIIAQTRFEVNVIGHLGQLLFVTMLFILIFIFLGMIIAYLFKSVQASVLTTTFVALLVYLFSDAVAPLEAMPQLAATIAALNPVVLLEGIAKKLLLFDFGLYYMQTEIILLGVYAAVLLGILIIVSKIRNKRRL